MLGDKPVDNINKLAKISHLICGKMFFDIFGSPPFT